MFQLRNAKSFQLFISDQLLFGQFIKSRGVLLFNFYLYFSTWDFTFLVFLFTFLLRSTATLPAEWKQKCFVYLVFFVAKMFKNSLTFSTVLVINQTFSERKEE